jgi:two-component system sensor histidine kinase KdpD
MNYHLGHKWVGYLISAAGIALVITGSRLFVPGINQTTVGFSFLLIVLIASSTSGLGPGIFASIAGMLSFNYFFLPPIGAFTIQDPQNWIALTAFLFTAIIASHLSSKAQSRAIAAERRGKEIEKLYQLSRAIISIPETETVAASLANYIVDTFAASYCSILFREGNHSWQRIALNMKFPKDISWSPSPDLMEEVFQNGETLYFPSPVGTTERKTSSTLYYAPLRLGIKPIGILVLISEGIEKTTIEAIAGLAALAIERARFIKAVSQTEALRQSNELKSALLASVSHDLRTPLTSISGAIDILLQDDVDRNKVPQRDFLVMIGEDVGRLTRLVDNLLEMARIEAGEVQPQREWNSIPEMIEMILDRCAPTLQNHEVEVNVENGLPMVRFDSKLIAEAFSNVVENAGHYSPVNTKIVLNASIQDDHLTFEIIDQGPGIAPEDVVRLFEKFYRGTLSTGTHRRGTGMGLAIAKGIVEAHGGKIWCETRPGAGSKFSISIPVECKKGANRMTTDEAIH